VKKFEKIEVFDIELEKRKKICYNKDGNRCQFQRRYFN